MTQENNPKSTTTTSWVNFDLQVKKEKMYLVFLD